MENQDLYEYLCSSEVKVMGVLNITPDSFFDGGYYTDPQVAVKRALEMAEEGADIIDIGAESTRPGSKGVTVDEEISRLEPVLAGISKKIDLPVSLDTSKFKVAKEFLKKGLVNILNDVTGFASDEMASLAKEYDVPCMLMHMYGTPRDMQKTFYYEDVVSDIKNFFAERLTRTGLEKVILDPGIGFGKSVEHNLQIIKRLKEFYSFGFPVMIGVSRKSFIGKILDLEAPDRLEGSLGAAAIAVKNGATIIRVHDVLETKRMIKIVEAIENVTYKEIQV